MKADLILLIFAVVAIALAGATVHGRRNKQPPAE